MGANDNRCDQFSNSIINTTGITSAPVAVFLIRRGAPEELFAKWKHATASRYCQMLMRSRHGESLIMNGDDFACPASCRAFGFKELPEGLKNGMGLIGFGITKQAEVGKAMFDGMTYLDLGEIEFIATCPLNDAPRTPDVIVVEGDVEQLMWISLAYLNLKGVSRIRSSTAILQATCVDSTIIPFIDKTINLSMGCYGCREATDLKPGETVLGFPGCDLEGIATALIDLNEKAMPRSRGKKVFEAYNERKEQSSCRQN